MRKWGILTTLFYALIIVFVLVPVAVLLVGIPKTWSEFWHGIGEAYGDWLLWVPIGMLVGGEALLLSCLSTRRKSA